MTGLLLAVPVALSACVQATTGMGFALVLSPVLLVALTPTTAIVLLTGLSLALNSLVLLERHERRPQIASQEVSGLLLAAIPGSVGGLLLLRTLPKPALEVGVGVIVVALALPRLAPVGWGGPRRPGGMRQVGARRVAVGALAGMLSTSIGVNGPPLALWLAGRGLGLKAVRDSLAVLFLGMGLITALTLVPALGSVHLSALVLATSVAGVLVGHAAGSRLHRRLGHAHLQGLLSLVILASGASAVVVGLTGA